MKTYPCDPWIERDLGDRYIWACEKCECTFWAGYYFCPHCGRRIAEFVKYRDPLEEVEE